MRPAKRARIQLRQNWNGAVTVQCVLLAADILLAILELGALLLMGLGVGQGVSIDGFGRGKPPISALWPIRGRLPCAPSPR